MQYHYCFKAVNQTFQDIWDGDQFFDDLPIMIKQNFAQILLVVCQGIKATIVGVFI